MVPIVIIEINTSTPLDNKFLFRYYTKLSKPKQKIIYSDIQNSSVQWSIRIFYYGKSNIRIILWRGSKNRTIYGLKYGFGGYFRI